MGGRRGSYRGDEIPTLYVRQVHYSARPNDFICFFSPDDLRELFERMGPVRDVYIPLDYYTRESRGFAYIKFEFIRDAEDALKELNGASVLGRRIEVEWAEGQRKRLGKTSNFSAKSEMRARDSYSSYRIRNRYRSRSPCKSGRECSPPHRSRSRRRSYSRPKRRSRNSRRWSRNSRRRSRSSRRHYSSIQKNRGRGRKMERSKSPSVSGSSLYSLNEIKKPRNKKQVSEQNTSKRQIVEELKEPVISELEIRNEGRVIDIEVDGKQIQKAVQTSGSIHYNEDHVGVGGSNASVTEEEEEDKAVTDIEIIVVEQNGIIFNDAAVKGDCLDDTINVQELLITDTTS
uniref:RRM domain-containing protein n=1 Tax=Elaeophora elaphi TaxID=1147741 RepID=A0A0R3S355_9BILA